MICQNDRKIALTFKRRLKAVAPVQKMVVFGSRARGDAGEESDFDIFIEVAKLTPDLRQAIREIAWEVSLEQGVVITTLVATSQDMVNSPLAASPVMQAIRNEGVAI